MAIFIILMSISIASDFLLCKAVLHTCAFLPTIPFLKFSFTIKLSFLKISKASLTVGFVRFKLFTISMLVNSSLFMHSRRIFLNVVSFASN